jgi:hypothetical protein
MIMLLLGYAWTYSTPILITDERCRLVGLYEEAELSWLKR